MEVSCFLYHVVVRYISERSAVLHYRQPIPTDLRDAHSGAVKLRDTTWNDAETCLPRALLAGFKKQLHAQTDPEEWAVIEQILAQRFEPSLLPDALPTSTSMSKTVSMHSIHTRSSY